MSVQSRQRVEKVLQAQTSEERQAAARLMLTFDLIVVAAVFGKASFWIWCELITRGATAGIATHYGGMFPVPRCTTTL